MSLQVDTGRAATNTYTRADIQYSRPIDPRQTYTIETGGLDASFQHHNRDAIARQIATQAVDTTMTDIMSALNGPMSASNIRAQAIRTADNLAMAGPSELSQGGRGDPVKEQVATLARDRVGHMAAVLAERAEAERKKPDPETVQKHAPSANPIAQREEKQLTPNPKEAQKHPSETIGPRVAVHEAPKLNPFARALAAQNEREQKENPLDPERLLTPRGLVAAAVMGAAHRLVNPAPDQVRIDQEKAENRAVIDRRRRDLQGLKAAWEYDRLMAGQGSKQHAAELHDDAAKIHQAEAEIARRIAYT